MKKYIIIAVTLLVAVAAWFAFASFRKKELTDSEFIQWVQDKENGLVCKKEMDGYIFELQYNPLDYMVAKECARKQVPQSERRKITDEYKGMQYFTLKMSTGSEKDMLDHNCEDAEQRMLRLEYLTGVMQEDIFLLSGKDTLPCLLYHFEQNYGLAPYNHVSLGFENPDSVSVEKNPVEKVILLNERVFGLGRMYFTINGNDIASVPHLSN